MTPVGVDRLGPITAGMTAEGVGIGTSEDHVRRIYAKAKIELTPHACVNGHYLKATMPGFADLRYAFETDGKNVAAFLAGRLPEVDAVKGCT